MQKVGLDGSSGRRFFYCVFCFIVVVVVVAAVAPMVRKVDGHSWDLVLLGGTRRGECSVELDWTGLGVCPRCCVSYSRPLSVYLAPVGVWWLIDVLRMRCREARSSKNTRYFHSMWPFAAVSLCVLGMMPISASRNKTQSNTF